MYITLEPLHDSCKININKDFHELNLKNKYCFFFSLIEFETNDLFYIYKY